MHYYNAQSLQSMNQRSARIPQQQFQQLQEQSQHGQSQQQYQPQLFNNVQAQQQNYFGGFSSFNGIFSSSTTVEQHNQVLGGYSEQELAQLEGQGNEKDSGFDLGADGAFSDFSILVGCFYSEVLANWHTNAGSALKKKGFRVEITDRLGKFLKELDHKDMKSFPYDVVWMISGSQDVGKDDARRLRKRLSAVSRSGRGLFIFGDNAPYITHANVVLPHVAGCVLTGNTPGARVLGYGNGEVPGEFDSEHLVFAGINYLFEGITICYPENSEQEEKIPIELKTIATSSNGKPCISVVESTDEHGRVIVDTGFTKLYLNWKSAGQARYVVNATVWCVDVERRFGADLSNFGVEF